VLVGASTDGRGVQVAGTSTVGPSSVAGGVTVSVVLRANTCGVEIALTVGARVGKGVGVVWQPVSKNTIHTRIGITGVIEAEDLPGLGLFSMVPVIVPIVSQYAISYLY
jgi:hypothetical protein